jgi:hypothetical protein
MVKVNRGWDTLPFDEVESLASASVSKSSPAVLASRIVSPRAALARDQARARSQPPRHSSPHVQEYRVALSDAHASSYEKFWAQGQAGQNARPRRSFGADTLSAPVLSRSGSLATSTTAHDFGVHGESSRPAPRTPGRSKHAYDTAHKSMEERDAIETLLFMSSPGKPIQDRPRSRTAQPSRFLSPPRRVARPTSVPEGRSRMRLRDDELDRMLDAMPDRGESSEDED